MAVDTALHVGTLTIALPLGSEAASELDNNIRHIKEVLFRDFPGVTGVVLPTHTELNYVNGVTSAIQTQIDAKAPTASPTFTGTPAAPTATVGTSTTQVATTAFTAAAIANVNANTALTTSIDGSAAITASAGQHIVANNVAAVAITLPASPAAGNRIKITFTNGLYTNTIDPGSNKLRSTSGVMTINKNVTDLEFTYTNAAWGWSF